VLGEDPIEGNAPEVFMLELGLGRCSEKVKGTARPKLGPGKVREITVEGLELGGPGTFEIRSKDSPLKPCSLDEQEDGAALANTREEILVTGVLAGLSAVSMEVERPYLAKGLE